MALAILNENPAPQWPRKLRNISQRRRLRPTERLPTKKKSESAPRRRGAQKPPPADIRARISSSSRGTGPEAGPSAEATAATKAAQAQMETGVRMQQSRK